MHSEDEFYGTAGGKPEVSEFTGVAFDVDLLSCGASPEIGDGLSSRIHSNGLRTRRGEGNRVCCGADSELDCSFATRQVTAETHFGFGGETGPVGDRNWPAGRWWCGVHVLSLPQVRFGEVNTYPSGAHAEFITAVGHGKASRKFAGGSHLGAHVLGTIIYELGSDSNFLETRRSRYRSVGHDEASKMAR